VLNGALVRFWAYAQFLRRRTTARSKNPQVFFDVRFRGLGEWVDNPFAAAFPGGGGRPNYLPGLFELYEVSDGRQCAKLRAAQ